MTKPIHKHKEDGTFRRDRHGDKDFSVMDGLVKMIPQPPEDYDDMMKEIWQRYWRHLVKHGYGKESDRELMDITIRAYKKYEHFRTFDSNQADKAVDKFMKGLDQLGIAPTSMAKMAAIQKKKEVKLSPTEIARQKAQGE